MLLFFVGAAKKLCAWTSRLPMVILQRRLGMGLAGARSGSSAKRCQGAYLYRQVSVFARAHSTGNASDRASLA